MMLNFLERKYYFLNVMLISDVILILQDSLEKVVCADQKMYL